MARSDLPESIVEAAARLFARYGFKKTSVDDLARAAHISKATLYHYFESKELLFAEVVRSEGQRMFQHIGRALAAAPTHAQKVKAFFTALFDATANSMVLQEATSEALVEILPLAQNVTRDLECEGRQRLGDLVRQGVEAGEFTVPDPERAADGLHLALHGLHVAFIYRFDLESVRQGLPALLELLLRGLTAPPSGSR